MIPKDKREMTFILTSLQFDLINPELKAFRAFKCYL